jgi:hypothetical protein
MRKIFYTLALMTLIPFWGSSQTNIILDIDGDNLYHTINGGCGDCWSTADPRWRSRFTINSVNYNWNVDRDDVPNCGWMSPPITNYTWFGPSTVARTTVLNLQFDGWEDDGFICGGNDGVCGGYATIQTLTPFTDGDPCQWNYRTAWRTCNNNGTGVYGVYWSYLWRYTGVSPTLSSPTPLNQMRCQASAPTALQVTSNSDAAGRSYARWYQWQISNTPNGPWSDIPVANGGRNSSLNTSTTVSYTPFRISGTRYYRVRVTNNCSADFANNTTTSAVFTVTYAFNTSSPYTTAPGGFPFGTGDGVPNRKKKHTKH